MLVEVVAPSVSVAVTVKVSVPVAVGVPVIVRQLLPPAGTTRPAMAFWILVTAKVGARAAAGGERLIVGHVDRVGRQARGPSARPG